MEYRLGTGLKIKDKGKSIDCVCPECNNKVSFSIFSNYKSNIISSFPFYKGKIIYFLVCPKCASIFTVDNDKGKALANGKLDSLDKKDFKQLKEFKVNND